MKYSMLILCILFLSSSCDLYDECSSDTEVVMFSGFGPRIEDPIQLSAGDSYTYNLLDAVYLADQEGGGRATCLQKNKRLPQIDSLVVTSTSVVTAEIIGESTLSIHAISTGSTSVSVYMSATVIGRETVTYHPTVTSTVVVE